MPKTNNKGKTWKQHAGIHLKKALKRAASTWKPKNQRTNMAKVKKLRSQRERVNAEIKKELDK